MIRLYPYFKTKALFLLLPIGLLLNNTSNAQCGPVVENFNNTGGSMAGFKSSTQANPTGSPGFVYASAGGNGYLQRCNIPGPDSVYEIASPTYQSLPGQTTVGFGFELSGEVRASEVNTFIEYIGNTSGTFDDDWISTVVPSYVNGTATICVTVPITTMGMPGFNAGKAFRLHFYIRPVSSSTSAQCMRFDNFRSTSAGALAPLPVNFISFFGRVASSGIQLVWNVAGEKEVSRYEVERSNNGRDFIKVGEVAASNLTNYNYLDKSAGEGVWYYRVRNVDVDGKYAYTGVIRINLNRSITLAAYPQPFRDNLTLEHGATEKGRITISSANGQVVKQLNVKSAMTQTVIVTTDLQPGLYIVRFDNGNGSVESLKVIKQ